MGFLSQWFDWGNADPMASQGFRLFWRWKSRPVGRPRLPKDIQALIHQMATQNPTWGQEYIANELKLKLGIRVSPRTVGKYLREWPRRQPDPSHRWLTFVRNHAQVMVMVACDFFVVVTARFRILYVFVLMELGRRRILHCNVTDHPSAEWTAIAEAFPDDHSTRWHRGLTMDTLRDASIRAVLSMKWGWRSGRSNYVLTE